MNKHKRSILRTIVSCAALVGLFSLAAPRPVHACGGAFEDACATEGIQPQILTGQAELSPGVPCGGCLILVENAPLGARTDANGYYTVKGLPPGLWTFKLSHPSYPAFGTKLFPCGVSGDSTLLKSALCPRVVLTVPGAVSGKITLPTSSDYDVAVVSIPELGLFTQTNGGGPGYLLTGVAPGWRQVVVGTGLSSASLWVYVQPGQVSMGMNMAVPMLPLMVFK